LKVLVTSRQVLQVYGEQEYLVPPLAVPVLQRLERLSALTGYEAVELFCERVQAVKPDFALNEDNAGAIAEICVRLDGLPLAIELAAARSKLLSAEMIRDRLESRLSMLTIGARDLPSRLQTLRGTIDWSYDLLDEGEQALFARLSVFQGGRTIEAAEEICAPGLAIPMMDGLESLLNRSLLHQEKGFKGEPRFLMLETIHEYAREKLAESGEAGKLQCRHAVYFAGLAEQAEMELTGPKQSDWFERLRLEHDNMRTALAFALANDEKVVGLRIASALRDFWNYGGHVGEGMGWIECLLDNAEDAPTNLRAKALNTAGLLSFSQGNLEQGKLFNKEALALYQKMGDPANSAWALLFLGGHSAGSLSEIKEGMTLTEQALALFRTQDDRAGIIQALNLRGELARLAGDYDHAGEAYEECLFHCRVTGNRLREAIVRNNLGLIAQYQGDNDQAISHLIKALVLSKDLNANYPSAIIIAVLSGPVAARGNPERAAQLLGASDGLLKAIGLCLQPADQPEVDRFETAVRQQLGEEAFKSAWEKGQAMSLEQAIAFALEDDTEAEGSRTRQIRS
jgi:non-specific serine/threonine protein kinase